MKKAKDKQDDLAGAWFVRADELGQYAEKERVYDTDENGHKRLRRHPKGSFIYQAPGAGSPEVGELLHPGFAHEMSYSA